MQRYFADIDNNGVHLSKDDEHHITHVMRMRVGDQFEVVSSSKLYICEISSLSPLGVKILKEQDLNAGMQLKGKMYLVEVIDL